ncbi:sugar-binding transcriptional regulator [bacterium]|nr:sugar-binding transcriptional regulator [bacterium]
MNSVNNTSLLVETARLYYDHQMSQQQIADRLGTSRPSISRLLQQARDQGIVRIEIIDPTRQGSRLEQNLKEKYHLKKVIVVPADIQSEQKTKKRLGWAAARYLNELIFDDCILGVSWGTTMCQVVNHLTPRPVKNMKVIQIVGGITHGEFDPHAGEITQRISENYSARSYLLLLPAIVDSAQVKQAMISDKKIRESMDLARQADIILCSMGVFKPDSLMIQAEYFNPEEVQYLNQLGAVGDICSRMISNEGNLCWPELDARTVAIELNDLKNVSHAIAVAGGMDKKTVIHAGLLGRYFNVLITDEQVAEYLLET